MTANDNSLAAGLVEAFYRAHKRSWTMPWTNPEIDVAEAEAENAYRTMLEELCRYRDDDPHHEGLPLRAALCVSDALAFAIYYMAGHCRDEIIEREWDEAKDESA